MPELEHEPCGAPSPYLVDYDFTAATGRPCTEPAGHEGWHSWSVHRVQPRFFRWIEPRSIGWVLEHYPSVAPPPD